MKEPPTFVISDVIGRVFLVVLVLYAGGDAITRSCIDPIEPLDAERQEYCDGVLGDELHSRGIPVFTGFFLSFWAMLPIIRLFELDKVMPWFRKKAVTWYGKRKRRKKR